MKQTLKRFATYLLVLAVLITIFQAWPALPPSGTSNARMGYYAGLWIVLFALMLAFASVFEVLYRIFRTKHAPVLETQPLAPSPTPISIQDQPTAGIETQRLDHPKPQ
jgi:hypothetical protein